MPKQLNFDVFNALNVMDNDKFLKDLKFGMGDGNLQYYYYDDYYYFVKNYIVELIQNNFFVVAFLYFLLMKLIDIHLHYY